MEDRTRAEELDQWIAKLQDCKQLEESQVKVLCDKVSMSSVYNPSLGRTPYLALGLSLFSRCCCACLCVCACACVRVRVCVCGGGGGGLVA